MTIKVTFNLLMLITSILISACAVDTEQRYGYCLSKCQLKKKINNKNKLSSTLAGNSISVDNEQDVEYLENTKNFDQGACFKDCEDRIDKLYPIK